MEEKKQASKKKIKERKPKRDKKEAKKEKKKKRVKDPSSIEDSIANVEHDVLLNEDHTSNERQNKSQLGPQSQFKKKMTK